LYEEFSGSTRNQNIDFMLNLSCCSDLSKILNDRKKIVKILRNLLQNAFKYTEEGFIVLGCSINNETTEFFVKDSGKGDTADLKTILECGKDLNDHYTLRPQSLILKSSCQTKKTKVEDAQPEPALFTARN
jgi:light-regulated signal transduction histidine kinase (bacteriophytochrome)